VHLKLNQSAALYPTWISKVQWQAFPARKKRQLEEHLMEQWITRMIKPVLKRETD